MGNPDAIRHNINHWVNALSHFGVGVSELSVDARSTIELTDDVFQNSATQPAETEWFHIDGRRYEVFLEDDCSMLRLANKRVLTSLQGDDSYPLVSWFGYNKEDYQLVRQSNNNLVDTDELDTTNIAWVAWDSRLWRSYLFNGHELSPISEASVVNRELSPGVSAITWLGWDGLNLDVFTSEFPQMSASTAAVFVAYDRSVLAIHSTHR